jgi:GT2 family glycosyltransferase
MNIDIIIPVYNHKEYLELCLRHVLKSTKNCRIVLVDAGSEKETRDYLKSLSGVEVYEGYGRLSFSKACNIAVSKSTSKYVAVLNTDVVVSDRWLEKLQRYLDSDDNIAMVSAISNWQKSIMGFEGYGNTRIQDILPIETSLCNEMAKTGVFEIVYEKKIECYAVLARRELIYFDEEYDNGFEDYDLCSRLNEKGYKVCLAPDVMVFHFGAVSRGLESVLTNESLYEKKRVYVPAVIPMKMGHFIHPDVVKSICKQSRKLTVYPIVTARSERDHGDGLRQSSGYFSQAEARNIGKTIVLNETNSEFIYFQDCSVVLTDTDAVQKAITQLRSDDKLGVVYFNVHPDFDGELEHFSAASMIMKRAVAEQIDFVAESTYQCFCTAYAQAVVAKGFDVQYCMKEPMGFEVVSYGRNHHDISCFA